MSWRCDRLLGRREGSGSRSRPRNSPCRTARGRRAWRRGFRREAGFSTIENSPEAPVKSRFHSAWPGSDGKSGVDHPRDLGPFGKPARDLKRRALMALKPHAEAAQAPQAEIDVLRPRAKAEVLMRLGDRRRASLVHGDGAEHDVRMAADIFRRCLDRDIGAMGERLEIERRRPGIVENDHRSGSMRGLGDGRNVLHLECLRARRFGEHDLGLLGDESLRCRRRCRGRSR